jgi:general secretion pathway protein G
MSIFVAWRDTRDADGFTIQQRVTRRQLEMLDVAISRYRAEFNSLPASLSDLPASGEFPPFERGKIPVDGWRRPFVYTIDGTNWQITSYGRDGRPGGEGLDSDLTDRNPWPKSSSPTLHQFALELPSATGIIMTCLVSGILSALLTLFTVKRVDLSRSGLIYLCWTVGTTTIAAAIFASFIAALHVPSH